MTGTLSPVTRIQQAVDLRDPMEGIVWSEKQREVVFQPLDAGRDVLGTQSTSEWLRSR